MAALVPRPSEEQANHDFRSNEVGSSSSGDKDDDEIDPSLSEDEPLDIPARLFQRCIEDFNCGHCGFLEKGDGYTNHCSQCLWSKHVDVNPGDRAASCQGLMRPVLVDTKKGQYRFLQRCEVNKTFKR